MPAPHFANALVVCILFYNKMIKNYAGQTIASCVNNACSSFMIFLIGYCYYNGCKQFVVGAEPIPIYGHLPL
jgi:hypothetical protein